MYKLLLSGKVYYLSGKDNFLFAKDFFLFWKFNQFQIIFPKKRWNFQIRTSNKGYNFCNFFSLFSFSARVQVVQVFLLRWVTHLKAWDLSVLLIFIKLWKHCDMNALTWSKLLSNSNSVIVLQATSWKTLISSSNLSGWIRWITAAIKCFLQTLAANQMLSTKSKQPIKMHVTYCVNHVNLNHQTNPPCSLLVWTNQIHRFWFYVLANQN